MILIRSSEKNSFDFMSWGFEKQPKRVENSQTNHSGSDCKSFWWREEDNWKILHIGPKNHLHKTGMGRQGLVAPCIKKMAFI